MKRTLILLFILVFNVTVYGQIFRTYSPGSYYDLGGKKITGLISFVPYRTHIIFKAAKDSSSRKIQIENLTAVVMARPINDSVSVQTEDGKDDKRFFAKLELATPTMKLYGKFHQYVSGGAPTMSIGAAPNMGSTGSQPAFHNTYTWSTGPSYAGTARQYLTYQDGTTTHKLTKGNFMEVMTKALANFPGLIAKLGTKHYKFADIDNIINEYRANFN